VNTPKGNNFSSRERKTIILLSVIMVFAFGVLLFVNDNEKTGQPATSSARQPRNLYSPDTTYQQQIAERRKLQEEHYRNQAEHFRRQDEHYRLQDEYYAQKDQFYRQEIERMRQQNAQRARQYNSPADHAEPVISPKFSTLTVIDPNTADSATLCSIPGIGKGIATSILRQRQRLGGFHSLDQLLECHYFTEDLLPWFSIGTEPELRRININKASFYQLVSHPYISKAQTQDILNYIRLYGNIKDADQLATTAIFTPAELSRLLPYLQF